MPTTTYAGLRYPQNSDGPYGPQQIQNLATDVDTKVIVPVATPSARTALTGVPAGMQVFEQSTKRYYYYDGSAWQYAGGAPPPIVGVTMFGGWTALTGHIPGCYKDASGLVKIVGVCTNDSLYNPQDGGTHTVFTLPTGYRPAELTTYIITTGGTAGTMLFVQVDTNGIVRVIGGMTNTMAVGQAHFFQNIPAFHPTYAGSTPLA